MRLFITVPTLGGAGGSGYVKYGLINVTFNQTFAITIGAGGTIAANGGTTTFGNNTLVANGGNMGNDCLGGNGGSGGGAGVCASISGNSGGGGAGGSNGTAGTYFIPGYGQGSSFMSYLSEFKLNVLSPGLGAASYAGGGNYYPGGGGGGGVLVNGAGPNSTGGTYCFTKGYGPAPATGYGAGGSGGCFFYSTPYDGYNGVSGLVYIEY